jgi:hypothetical protein
MTFCHIDAAISPALVDMFPLVQMTSDTNFLFDLIPNLASMGLKPKQKMHS